jgi:hypothetical protein
MIGSIGRHSPRNDNQISVLVSPDWRRIAANIVKPSELLEGAALLVNPLTWGASVYTMLLSKPKLNCGSGLSLAGPQQPYCWLECRCLLRNPVSASRW